MTLLVSPFEGAEGSALKNSLPRKRKRGNNRSSRSASEGTTTAAGTLFPVVGVGASAGGLEAFSKLLADLPENTRMAFVFVQHLDPTHTSALEEILSRSTKIPVTEVTDGTVVQSNHIYVIPPNADLAIRGGVLRLSPRTLGRGQHRPIDSFLHSLAEDCGERSIAVILSGTASDGTSGCLAVKAVGGITFAQDEATAKHSGMPHSAAEAGCVDFVLPPKGIAEELARIEKHPYIAKAPAHADELLSPVATSDVNGLFTLLREATGVDFAHYKQSTLQRRIKRRMVLNQTEKLADYVRLVRRTPTELDELYRDILIHVTGFFRDPGAFDALRKVVFPALAKDRQPSAWSIRVWIPGCSTGEEAYSMAMALLEYLEPEKARYSSASNSKPIQIFATDVSEESLDRARTGIYSEATVGDVAPARLKRFFSPVDKGYQINQFVRELCIFAKQNIAKDPPFSNLDLVSCRNLLIYLGPELQKRVIPTMHYALNPGGYLMLGGAESLGIFSDHFTLVDKKYKIYQRKGSTARLVSYFTGVDYSLRRPSGAKSAKNPPPALGIEKEVEQVLTDRFVPASIVLNSDMEIVQFRGKTGPYLEPATGHPTFSLSKMAREGLLIDLRAALHTAKKDNVVVRKEGVSIQSNGGTREINFEVIPVQGEPARERFYVVVFQDAPVKPAEKSPRRSGDAAAGKQTPLAQQNQRLTREIKQLHSQMQSLIEEHETTSEEFKTANEEVLSSNEELQSTNEELETAKEELQSSNEELTTVNEELNNRNVELSTANNDLLNLLGNVNIPVVIVGSDARIRRLTPAAEKLLNLLPSDIGRRLGQVRPNMELDNLEQVARETIETATPREAEVRDSAGVWYLMRARPYKTSENKIEGAVISFQDIDALKRLLEATRTYADTLVESAREAILILDAELRVVVANAPFYKSFQVSASEVIGRSIFELGNQQWNILALRNLLESITHRKTRIDDFEVRHNFQHLGERIMLLNARRVEPRRGEFFIFLSFEDVTEVRKQADRQMALLDLAHDAVMVRDVDATIQFWNHGAEELYGWNKNEALGKKTHDLLKTQFPIPFQVLQDELQRNRHWEGELIHTRRDGRRIVVRSRWVYLEEVDVKPVILEINADVTDKKESEENLRELTGRLMQVQDEERRRIARELHDSIGQKLAVAKLNLDTMARAPESKTQATMMKESSQLIDEAFREVRTISQLLHPPLLDETGLASAARWLTDGFAERSKIKVEFKISGKLARLPQPVELTLFRVIQESLSNIHRHSEAKAARVHLAQTPQAVTLEIQDDGKGLPKEMLSGSSLRMNRVGVGILGMSERLAQLGGSLEISAGKTGTTVRAVIPNAQAAQTSA